jgi:outer membrane protein OmpA-like peptidoglycan-associated protein
MTEDWAADVKKYDPAADDGVIAAIVRYCGTALQNRDASLVAFTDPAETGRVRENFLKKKLGLTESDEVLDQAIAAVGHRMKDEHFRKRVTVYYLLLQHFGLLHMFGAEEGEAGDHDGIATAGLAATGLGVAAAGLAGKASTTDTTVAAVSPGSVKAAYTPPPARPVSYMEAEPAKERNWLTILTMLLAALLAPFLLWLLFRSLSPAEPVVATQTAAPAPAPAAPAVAAVPDLSTAPAEGTVAIPTGAGVTVEMRNGKPVVKVYFDTGKADVAPEFAATAAGLKAYLAAHLGSSLAVSGFNDKTGNAAANAILSKNRATAVDTVLTTAGIASSAIALVKPADTTDTTVSNANARRVEVVVR